METIWTFTVIIIGAFSPSPDAADAGFIGGDVKNTSVVYFETEKACNDAHALMVKSKSNVVKGLVDAKITISKCSASKFTVK